MANTARAIKCKSCDRALATVSPNGLFPADLTSTQGCDTCQQFAALYDAMQAADEEYAPLHNKGDRHRGKQVAVAKVNKTHMDFDNWLMGVEAPVKQNAERENGAEEEGQEEEEPIRETVEEQQGIKRARSHSPTPQQSGVDETLNEPPENPQPQQQQTLSIPHRPSSKRSHSTRSLPERKRLKFSDSVEFRDDYRSYLTLGRSSEEYAPGRYAPPEGGYLDTSGADQSFPKFTGLKKVRGTWVEVKEKDNKSENKGTRMTAELHGLGDSGEAIAQEHGIDPAKGGSEEDDAALDSRSARLARRTRKSSDLGTAQETDDVAHRTIATARRGRGKSLDSTSDQEQNTSSDAATFQQTTDAERGNCHTVDIATSATDDIRASDQKLDGDIGGEDSLA